jgi:hypothetical protein
VTVRSSFALAAVATFAVAGPGLAQSPAPVERVFTTLDLAKCRHTPGRAEEDYGAWRCVGHAGIPILVTAGDQRSYVSYGPQAAREPAARQTLAAFNGAGRTIEWRIERRPDGRRHPFATILRWSTTRSDDRGDPIRGQVLVVTRLPPGGVCHVGYIDGRANANANELAIEIADRHARGFKCGVDKPVVSGVKGPGFSGPSGGD